MVGNTGGRAGWTATETAATAAASALDPAELAADVARLGAWLEAADEPGGRSAPLDDAARVDAIRALERLTCVATAAQARLTADLDASQRAEQAVAGVPAARRGRGVAAQVALARRESPHRGRRHLGLATIVTTELPHTWRAWRTGRITEWRATLVARETACLSLDDRLAVDRSVAGDPDLLEAMGEAELVGALRAEAYRLDPESFVTRRRRAESERHVGIRPAPDTMAWVGALLPVKEGVAVHATLARHAATARAGGDPRTKGQVMADALVAAVLGHQHDPAPDAQPTVPVTLGVVVDHGALLGTSDEPAHVDGYGPVPAELAREWVADALARDERVWLRRLYACPDTGELVAMGARSRLFPASLGRFIRLRDRTCRTPWCDAPIRHGDHVHGHAEGGSTSAGNAQGLCEACNHAKQAPGWRARPSPHGQGHEVETRTPTGHTYRSRPPPLVRVREPRLPPLTVDYVLAG